MPVDLPTLAAFLATAGALVLSPGPDTVLILRYTLTSGQKAGLATVAGVQIGLAVHTLLAVLGISLIIAQSPILFASVAVLGAAYLGWLGVQGLIGGGRLSINTAGPSIAPLKAMRDAIVTNILNPKVIILFLALFPNFVDYERGDVPAQLITLSLALVIINTLWQAPMAWLAERARRWLTRPAVQSTLSRGTGAILLFFAVTMLYEHIIVTTGQ
ncbi:MAG: LysE family translocator [Rhodospirillales bacterium]|nr:LysE family translocator [Rhodospirillales bacterium]MCW8862193.1 LysE family translocator [Rhodospirillales bacterium]MCW8952054.1 LysE family translocator [Rhodospirillales bacterium]MCW9002544.1 LysE family translocator [Rhodospirillales bacterium]MCW9039262.1 LysE family translocator [Rhodospirillales bacterium]